MSLTAFQEELHRKPAGFGPPPAAGGVSNARASSETPDSGEKKEAIQDLHADRQNVIKGKTKEELITAITAELKSFAKNDEIAKEMQTLVDNPKYDDVAEKIKTDPSEIVEYLTAKWAKFALLAAAYYVGANQDTLISLVETIKA
ncbi:Oidioi.mRNA.OKI2018_I69.PAR.g9853.t1.cds [Oikopleura dioica]|uniref:Oidioi.mRNA.OKI2018_I69.PAR.g9853.t1.cds n=1 Tax=Oikopleura dioica TaxID=34765 RepID=A0ABN7RVC3_OIKDI|nr:Oidioi.mRNA.OKI2018_I69.PAR.g9853.t1.cds [Oikopleura dioica]